MLSWTVSIDFFMLTAPMTYGSDDRDHMGTELIHSTSGLEQFTKACIEHTKTLTGIVLSKMHFSS